LLDDVAYGQLQKIVKWK